MCIRDRNRADDQSCDGLVRLVGWSEVKGLLLDIIKLLPEGVRSPSAEETTDSGEKESHGAKTGDDNDTTRNVYALKTERDYASDTDYEKISNNVQQKQMIPADQHGMAREISNMVDMEYDQATEKQE